MSNMIASAHKSVYHARWVVEILGFDELCISYHMNQAYQADTAHLVRNI